MRRACARHLWDLRRGPARGLKWDPARARYYISFFSYLRHSKGPQARKRFTLAWWQQFCVGSVYGWIRADGTRRFRVWYSEVPRKNGKSTLLAGVGLIGLVADRELGAEVYSAATKRDQARIIFDEARRMARTSPELMNKVSVFKLNISVDSTASKFEPLSADDRTLDGLNPSCILVDELHKHKTRALLDVMDTAVGARDQPLLAIITTAGDDDPESVYSAENDYAVKILDGVIDDDNEFVWITTIDKGDRWDDPMAWAKANPNLNVSVKFDDLKRQADKAKKVPSAQAVFQRLRLNVRSSSANKFILTEVWNRNSLGPFDPAIMQGRSCFGALDISSKIDLSAWCKLFPPIDDEQRWRAVWRFWCPMDTVLAKQDRDRVPYQRWIDEGFIEPTPGNVIDQNAIKDAILEDMRLHRIESIAFDPWNATKLSTELQEAGAPMFEFIQGVRSYTAPTKELQSRLMSYEFDCGDNPVATWMASNLKVESDKNENLMPTKRKSIGRIDGITALIMAFGRSIATDETVIRDSMRVW